MLITYFQQVEEAARVAKVQLFDAYQHAGLSPSNYYRHRTGQYNVSEKLAVRLIGAIRQIDQARRDRLSRLERSLRL